MSDLISMIWIELVKAIRSRMPLWTALGALFMPIGIAFLIFLARNPEISNQLGLMGNKANLMTYSSIDWPAYLTFTSQMVAAGEFFVLVLSISWIFGREFADGTLKDILAVPVPRLSIVLAKFILVVIWAAVLSVLILLASLGMGALIGLPGGSSGVMLPGGLLVLETAGLVLLGVLPFAFFASVSRGYLLPLGMSVLVLIAVNLVLVLGCGAYFPWAVPLLFTQGKGALLPISYWIVLFTSLAGMFITYLWWMYADHKR